ncbi:putative MFS family arabinose efflux permease [Kribbella amoyensis]|uniref:Putative MFS family arabinose efflux permease n=1 Tax=Kribbella amoyensis TaxID=996641 RepID=A0A561BLX4_9ACTN|nr:MFS transporter [Kribbella amoyensis]TWD79833.1 putative MFS family arabinose efflux permease [Kribbella amoyensis]
MKQPLQSSLWSSPDLRLVLPARALSYAGDSIALIALMLRVSDTGGPAATTALLLAFALPTVAMIPFAGKLVDSHDSRTVLVSASLLQAAAGVCLALVDGLAATLALVCVLQVGQAVAGPAWAALIPRIVGEELVGRATGVSQALTGVAMLAGSAAGGVLVAWKGETGALLVDAGTFAMLAVVACLVKTRRRPVPSSGEVERGGLSVGLRTLFADDLLKILVPALWVFILVGEALNVVEVFLIRDELGLGPDGYGAVLAAQGAGAVVGAWSCGRLTSDPGRARAVLLGTGSLGLAAVVMGVAPGVVLLVLGAVVMGAGGGLLNAATSTLVVTRSPEAVRGRVIAALTGTARASSLLALLLGGAVGSLLGPRLTFVAGGAAGAVTAMVAGVLVWCGQAALTKSVPREPLPREVRAESGSARG